MMICQLVQLVHIHMSQTQMVHTANHILVSHNTKCPYLLHSPFVTLPG